MPKSTSENLLKAVKDLFRAATIPSRSTRPLTVTPPKVNRSPIRVDSYSGGVGFGQCFLGQISKDDLPTQDRERFQVKLRNYVVGEFTNKKQATNAARQLERLLNDSALKPSQIQPGLVSGMPAVKWGDRILFALSKQQTQSVTCNSELPIIQWVNNLRTALAEQPLTLTEAQEKMYSLQATNQTIDGLASWYGPYFNGRQTATGETFDENDFTAAHPSLPFDTYLKVRNLNNGKSVIVRVNDRGPYLDNRALDLSREAARSLGSEETGVVPVEAVIMKPAPVANDSPATVAKL